MEQVKDLHEFIDRGYDSDVKKIIHKKFANILGDGDITEVTNTFYLKMLESKTIEKFDPKFNVKFSTYIYTCLHNFMLSGYKLPLNRQMEKENLSLDMSMDDKTTMHHFIASEETDKDFDIDRKAIRNKLAKYKRGKVNFDRIYELTQLGHTDPEIACILGVTATYVGIVKKDIREILYKFCN